MNSICHGSLIFIEFPFRARIIIFIVNHMTNCISESGQIKNKNYQYRVQ